MRKAILYIRVSTDEQAEKGYSLKHQEERLRTYCDQQNIIIAGIYKDDHSAKSFERPEFQKLLSNLKKNKGVANLLLFTKWDRFSRNAPDAYAMLNQLNKLSIEAQAIEQPLDLSVPENKIMLGLYLIAPEVENDRRALNTLVGMRRAKKEGRYMATAPKGYKNTRNENNKPIIAPSNDASFIRKAFEELAKGTTDIETLRKELNKEGFNVSRSQFWCLVRNPIYCGKIFIPAYKDEAAYLVKGIHEPIISESLFYDVQDILNGRKRNVPAKNTKREELPLRGFLVCKRCGKLLTGSASHGNGGKYFYYHCQHNSGCKERFKAKEANQLFINQLGQIVVKPKILDTYYEVMSQLFKKDNSDKAQKLKNIQADIDKLNQRIKNAQSLMLDGELEASEYKEIKASLQPQIEKLERQKVQTADGADDYERFLDKGFNILKNIDKYYESADLQGKQQIIGAIFSEKLIYEENQYRTTEPNPLLPLISLSGAHFKEIKKERNGGNSVPSYGVVPPRIELGSKV